MTNDELPREARTGPIFHPDWGTYAFFRYNGHVRGLDALNAMVFPMAADTEKSKRYLEARRLQVENDFSGPWSMDVRHSMLSWQVAMRVSAVEVYLQNALTFLAVFDADFMRGRGSKQEWTYDAMRVASDNDDSVWTFCNQWARGFVGDGGPARWSKALMRSGLGRFEESDVGQLEAMWGYRHMRVHHAGQFTREFIQRHREVAERIWQNGVQLSDVEQWSEAANRFVGSAEQGIAGRLKATLGEDLIGQRQNAESERQMAELRARWERIQDVPEEQREAQVATGMAQAEARFALMKELFGGEQNSSSAGPTEGTVAP